MAAVLMVGLVAQGVEVTPRSYRFHLSVGRESFALTEVAGSDWRPAYGSCGRAELCEMRVSKSGVAVGDAADFERKPEGRYDFALSPGQAEQASVRCLAARCQLQVLGSEGAALVLARGEAASVPADGELDLQVLGP